MLTRLEVDGFKNLAALDIRFGPFSCIAGPNGVGKSNIFDAISFLSKLADLPLLDAALEVRGGDGPRGDIAPLFRRRGDSRADRMTFAVEFIIPERGMDALGQLAEASMTFLRYELTLRYQSDHSIRPGGSLVIERESMVHVNRTKAAEHLRFHHTKAWRDSAVKGRRTSPYISTTTELTSPIVSLHADSPSGQGGGRPRTVPAASLPRTMLSSVNNAAEHRTLVLARQEMLSWAQLQLEPSALRAPSSLNAPRSIGRRGEHLPAALWALATEPPKSDGWEEEDLYARVANRLSELVEDVRRIRVDVDEPRRLLSIIMTDHAGTEHVAGALSDGTLRFLALAVMEIDPHGRGLICLEEPENGMHPQRIPSTIQLLRDIAVDPTLPVGGDNPLRQVIVNSHSPTVIGEVDDSELIVLRDATSRRGGGHGSRVIASCLPGTWRDGDGADKLTRGQLLTYLQPVPPETPSRDAVSGVRAQKVRFRPEAQLVLPLSEGAQSS